MSETIKLSIQEIVKDFEKLVRFDERLDALFDNKSACDKDVEEFYQTVEELIAKYIPNYEEKISPDLLADDVPTYDKALTLYKPLYRNFKEIFYKLI